MEILYLFAKMTVEEQAKGIKDVRRNFACERCRRRVSSLKVLSRLSYINTRIQSIAPRLVPQSSPLERSSRSGTPRRVDQNLKTTRRSTQRTTSVEDPRPTVTPVQAKPNCPAFAICLPSISPPRAVHSFRQSDLVHPRSATRQL